jgi:hypothetical protein
MPVVNMPMTKSTARDLFAGALKMMILQSLRRQPAHGYLITPSGLGRLERISFVLNPGKSIAT